MTCKNGQLGTYRRNGTLGLSGAFVGQPGRRSGRPVRCSGSPAAGLPASAVRVMMAASSARQEMPALA